MTKCPVCHSAETRPGLDKITCVECGAVFDFDGKVDDPKEQFVVGNLADLQRGGAEAHAAGTTGGDHMTAAGPPLAVQMPAAAPAGDDDGKPASHAHKKG